jgi:hypothetical protein
MQMFEKQEVLDLTPDYQRRARWNDKKRSHLIESLLMNVPIPPVFLYESEYAKYEVMDGQQRLTSVRSFFRNEFKLRGLRVWKELNGRIFRDLPPKIQKGLERRGIAAVIILTESSADPQKSMELRQYVFERLNTGGERLNPQEIRNCLYSSIFNSTVIRIARNDLFASIWEIPPKESGEPRKVSRKLERNPLYAKMADCEIVLRYFALSDSESYKGGMKKALDECMISKRSQTKEQCDALEAEYLNVLQVADDVFQNALFRLPKNGHGLVGRRSVPLADAVLIAIKSFVDRADKLQAKREAIVTATADVLSDPQKYNVLVGRGNTKKDIEARIELMKQVIGQAIS